MHTFADKQKSARTLESVGPTKLSRNSSKPRVTETAAESPQSSGKPLLARLRAELEPRFRHDISRVRIHVDADAARLAAAQHAVASKLGSESDNHGNQSVAACRSPAARCKAPDEVCESCVPRL